MTFSFLAGAGALGTNAAQADSPIQAFSVTTTTTQAGGHPDIKTLIDIETRYDLKFPAPSCNCQDAREIVVSAPAGVIANPHAAPKCTDADFGANICPPNAQIGLAHVTVGSGFGLGGIAVYNLIPHANQPGLVGFFVPVLKFPVYIVVHPRTESDYGLDLQIPGINHTFPVDETDLTFWGVPAASSNDDDRHPRGCEPFFENPQCYPGVVSSAPRIPFLSNPTTCGNTELTTSIMVLSYDKGVTTASQPYPATTGCDQLSFNPSLFAQPTTTETDSASGLAVDLKVPQDESPDVPSPSEIRAATVTLPEGISINPNAADGKTSCSNAQARFETEDEAECPEYSKVGSLSVESAALPGSLPGYVYLGEPLPGNRYRIFLVADGFGIHVKLPGTVTPDPQTGQLVISFQDLPQTPFSDFNIHLFGSERGLLATPKRCGDYSVKSTFTPWDSALPEQTSTQHFTLNSGPNGMPCPGDARPFGPDFQAGVADKSAGRHTLFTLDLTREDGDQNLAGLTVTTPPGFAATLAGIPYCSEAALSQLAGATYSGFAEMASSTCPARSQIGTVIAGAGAGSHPVYVTGKVYLAGPYKGAPLSLEAVIPAVSGPYDLGNVAVRAAINVDPVTAQVTAISDPLPQILEGVPLRARSILLSLDRPHFVFNPTNCDPFSIDAAVFGDEGGHVSLGSHFQVANCAELPYGPKLALTLTGGLRRRGHPAIHALLTAAPGEANSREITVTLPKGELLDNSHIGGVCTRVNFAADTCPSSSLVGNATVRTPILDRPLSGDVYLRSSSHELPDLALDLEGQLEIEAVGHIDSVDGRLRARFETVPDVPFSSIELDLAGGKKGLLQNSQSLCGATKKATVKMAGQNGNTINRLTKLKTSCGSKSRHKRRLRRSKAVG
jgi:hypothetical protein